jgi:hypothetical protein
MEPIQADESISARWHSHTRAKACFGFYDSLYQIALLPHNDVDPHDVIEHEMTHVNIVKNSSLGLLERVLVFLNWKARAERKSGAEEATKSLLDVVMAATEVVHEGTAWFGSELVRKDDTTFRTPPRYSGEVKRLRTLFEKMPEKPFSDLRSDPVSVINVADNIAIYALSPPGVEELWSQPKSISAKTLRRLLSRNLNNPLARFRQICSCLNGVSFPAIDSCWQSASSC